MPNSGSIIELVLRNVEPYRYKNKAQLEGMQVKEHGGITGNVILGDDRALILAGPVKNNELGFWTVEKEIIEKLNEDFEQYWTEGSIMAQEES